MLEEVDDVEEQDETETFLERDRRHVFFRIVVGGRSWRPAEFDCDDGDDGDFREYDAEDAEGEEDIPEDEEDSDDVEALKAVWDMTREDEALPVGKEEGPSAKLDIEEHVPKGSGKQEDEIDGGETSDDPSEKTAQSKPSSPSNRVGVLSVASLPESWAALLLSASVNTAVDLEIRILDIVLGEGGTE